tara:strand:- start:2146 stop:2574 length:429 start_codon:yes stop_codon:yes gene_type:complete
MEMEMNEMDMRIQAHRQWSDGGKSMLHIQGVGPEEHGNRNYGLAVDIRVPSSITEWLMEQQGVLRSGNDVDEVGNKNYLECSLYLSSPEEPHKAFLLVSGEEKNHADGGLIQLDVNSPSVKLLVDWAAAHGIFTDGTPSALG